MSDSSPSVEDDRFATHLRFHLSSLQEEGNSPNSNGEDVLKGDSRFGPGESIPSDSIDADSLFNENQGRNILDSRESQDSRNRVLQAGERSFAITPAWSYYNLASGETKHGGNLTFDFFSPVNNERTWMAHGGVDLGFVSGGLLTSSTFDVGKLADVEGEESLDHLILGASFDLLASDDVYENAINLSQVRTVIGWAINDMVDIGMVGVWPTHNDEVTSDPELIFSDPPDTGIFLTTEQSFKFTRQAMVYAATTLTDDLETVFYLGHRAEPDALQMGVDMAWTTGPAGAIVAGVAGSDRGDFAIYVGLQGNPNVDRFTRSRLRGFYHRLTRGGVFRTQSAATSIANHNSLAPITATETVVEPFPGP